MTQNRRQFLGGLVAGGVSLGVLGRQVAAQDAATDLGPAANALGQATATALDQQLMALFTLDTPEIPAAMVVPDANIDAEVEVTPIVDGKMMDPSGPWIVSWYDGTGKLGEARRNILMAGHVDYWDVGPAVFQSIALLQPGSQVNLYGERGSHAVYDVEYVERVTLAELTAEKLQSITGLTGYNALTIITCGGEFDYAAGEYLQRDVIRCRLASLTPGDSPDATPVATPDGTPAHARPDGQPSRITEDGVNLRAEATINSEALTVLPIDTVVTITGDPVDADGYTWYPITTADGQKGWVVSDFLQIAQ